MDRPGAVHLCVLRRRKLCAGATASREERNIAAINMVLLGIDEHEKRAGPTGNEVDGIDRVIAGHGPRMRAERRANLWCIDTGAGFPAMNRLTLSRPPTLFGALWSFGQRVRRSRTICLTIAANASLSFSGVELLTKT